MNSSEATMMAPGIVVHADWLDFTSKFWWARVGSPLWKLTFPVARPLIRYFDPLVLNVAVNWRSGVGVIGRLALPSEMPAALNPSASLSAEAADGGTLPWTTIGSSRLTVATL